MRNTADLKAGMTPAHAMGIAVGMGPRGVTMPIDGGKMFKQSTDAAKMGKDKGYPMAPIAAAPARMNASKQFTPKVTRPSPVAPKVTVPTFSSGAKVGGMIGWGSGGGMGMGRID